MDEDFSAQCPLCGAPLVFREAAGNVTGECSEGHEMEIGLTESDDDAARADYVEGVSSGELPPPDPSFSE
jgi:hypothetical protein